MQVLADVSAEPHLTPWHDVRSLWNRNVGQLIGLWGKHVILIIFSFKIHIWSLEVTILMYLSENCL